MGFAALDERLLFASDKQIFTLVPGEKPKLWASMGSRPQELAVVPGEPSYLLVADPDLKVIPFREHEGKAAFAPPVETKLSSMAAWPAVRAAREVLEEEKRPIWGPLWVATFQGTKRWALVTTETKPPARGVAVGRRPEPHKGKHECGRSMSRPLRDVSVRKDRQLFLFEGTKRIGEQLLQSSYDADPETEQVEIASEGANVVVDGVVINPDGKILRREKRVPTSPPPGAPSLPESIEEETIDGLFFDPASRQGAVAFHDAEWNSFAAIFGATPGEIRKVVPLPLGFLSCTSRHLALAGDAFFAAALSTKELQWLTGSAAGTLGKIPLDGPISAACDLLLHQNGERLERLRVRPDGTLLDLGALLLGKASIFLPPDRFKHEPVEVDLDGEARSTSEDALPEAQPFCQDGIPYAILHSGKEALRLDNGERIPATEFKKTLAIKHTTQSAPTRANDCWTPLEVAPQRTVQACVIPQSTGRKVELRWESQ